MQVLRGSKSFLMCCYAVLRVLWELRCCYAVAKVFQIIFSVLLCGCHSIVSCLIASLWALVPVTTDLENKSNKTKGGLKHFYGHHNWCFLVTYAFYFNPFIARRDVYECVCLCEACVNYLNVWFRSACVIRSGPDHCQSEYERGVWWRRWEQIEGETGRNNR